MYNPINYSSERESVSIKSAPQSSESAPLRRLQFTCRALLALAAPVLAMITVGSLGTGSDIRYESIAFNVTLTLSVWFLTACVASRFRDVGFNGWFSLVFLAAAYEPSGLGWVLAFGIIILCCSMPSRSQEADQEIQSVAASHSPA